MSESTPPPPATITPDDYHAADPARRRLAPKSSFGRRLSLKIKKKNIKPPLATASVSDFQPSMLDSESQTISLDSSNISTAEDDRDQYEWAVVYENQRGYGNLSALLYSQIERFLQASPSFPSHIIPVLPCSHQTLLRSRFLIHPRNSRNNSLSH